jgi:hypothetical protein
VRAVKAHQYPLVKLWVLVDTFYPITFNSARNLSSGNPVAPATYLIAFLAALYQGSSG